MSSRIKLLWCSHYHEFTTSQGIVSKYILKGLERTGKYDIIESGWCADEFLAKNFKNDWKVYFCHNDLYQKDIVEKIIYNEKPDVIIAFSDIGLWAHLATQIRPELRNTYKFYGYWYQDAAPFPRYLKKMLDYIDLGIVDHFYGKKVILDRFPEYENKIHTVLHGVDTKIFRPVPDRRSKLRKVYGLSDDDIVYFFNGRNIWRKQIPALLKAFKIVINEIKNAKLVLHTKIRDIKDSYTLDEKIADLEIPFSSIKITDRDNDLGVDTHILAGLYNMADIYVTCSITEAFDMPMLEAMASGLPVIANRIGTSEFWLGENRGVLIEPVETLCWHQYNNYDLPVTDTKNVARAMIDLANNTEKRKELGKNAFEFATKIDFSWDRAVRNISKLIDSYKYITKQGLQFDEKGNVIKEQRVIAEVI